MLKENGLLSLAIPDKRYCFDHFRTVTSVGDVIDDYLYKKKIHSAGSVADYYLNVVSMNNNISWNKYSIGDYKFVHSVQKAINGIKAVQNNQYLDIHEYKFTPVSFKLLIIDLNCLGYIDFNISKFHYTIEHEFFVTLTKSKDKSIISLEERINMLKEIELENSYNEVKSKRIAGQILTNINDNINFNIDVCKIEENGIIFIRGWAFILNVDSKLCNIYIRFLDNNTKELCFYNTINTVREDVANAYNDNIYINSGFIAYIEDKNISLESINIVIKYNNIYNIKNI